MFHWGESPKGGSVSITVPHQHARGLQRTEAFTVITTSSSAPLKRAEEEEEVPNVVSPAGVLTTACKVTEGRENSTKQDHYEVPPGGAEPRRRQTVATHFIYNAQLKLWVWAPSVAGETHTQFITGDYYYYYYRFIQILTTSKDPVWGRRNDSEMVRFWSDDRYLDPKQSWAVLTQTLTTSWESLISENWIKSKNNNMLSKK